MTQKPYTPAATTHDAGDLSQLLADLAKLP